MRIKNKYGETLLHYAAVGAKSDIAEFLISQGLDVNGTNTNGWTPLHCALTPASQGSQVNGLAKSISDALKLAELLLSHGADPLAVTAEGWTPLHCLAIFAGRKKSHTKLAQFVHDLARRGVGIHSRATFIFWNELGDKEPKYYYWGHEVEQSIADPGSSGASVRFGYTALHFAAAHGSMSLAKALLELGADPLSKDARGNTAIKVATQSSLIDDFPGTRQAMVKLLTEAADLYRSQGQH
jgi:ankyrin repeat protein